MSGITFEDWITDERRIGLVRTLYSKTNGRSWAPPNPNDPVILDLLAEGLLRRCDGICGFERIKDAFVAWTLEGIRMAEGGPGAAGPVPARSIVPVTAPGAEPPRSNA